MRGESVIAAFVRGVENTLTRETGECEYVKRRMCTHADTGNFFAR